jgi:hypothetical protein
MVFTKTRNILQQGGTIRKKFINDKTIDELPNLPKMNFKTRKKPIKYGLFY